MRGSDKDEGEDSLQSPCSLTFSDRVEMTVNGESDEDQMGK